MRNHGVTSPLWDMVFRTHEKVDVVKVPRRHVPPWLLDSNGKVRAECRETYVVPEAGANEERNAQLDRARVFANLVPQP